MCSGLGWFGLGVEGRCCGFSIVFSSVRVLPVFVSCKCLKSVACSRLWRLFSACVHASLL